MCVEILTTVHVLYCHEFQIRTKVAGLVSVLTVSVQPLQQKRKQREKRKRGQLYFTFFKILGMVQNHQRLLFNHEREQTHPLSFINYHFLSVPIYYHLWLIFLYHRSCYARSFSHSVIHPKCIHVNTRIDTRKNKSKTQLYGCDINSKH